MIDNLRIVLGTNAGEEFSFRFRDAEPIKGIFDVVGDIVPALFDPVRGFDIVVDVIVVESREVAAPISDPASA